MTALDTEEQAVVDTVRELVDREVRPRRARAGARQHLPREAHRADEGARHLRAGDPRAVGRGAGVDALLRAGHRGARPRLDEPGRRDGRAHRRREAAASTFGTDGAEATATCRGWPPARCAPRWRSPSPAAAPTCRPCAPTRAARRRRLRRQRRQDLDHQRPPLRADRAAVQDRPGGRAAAPGHQHPAGRARPGPRPSRKDLPKLGYKGVESCELVFDDYRVPADALLGGVEGQGFAQMMKGLETGRIQVAARALGVGRAAFEDALRYAQERESVRQADLAAPVDRQLPRRHGHQAHRRPPAHPVRRRAGTTRASAATWRPGMAKLFASETAMEIALERRAHPRRLRLLHRVRRRALLPRRPADDRRRGHQRDPAQRHRRASWSSGAGSTAW